MATKKPKGNIANGKKEQSDSGILEESKRDVFGDFAPVNLAVDFGEINPTALHSVISRVCRIGGYIGFSAPAGGAAVKLSITVADASGQRWVRDGHELAAAILAVHKQLDGLEPKQPT